MTKIVYLVGTTRWGETDQLRKLYAFFMTFNRIIVSGK